MRRIPTLILGSNLALLAACGAPEEPVFGDPVPVQVTSSEAVAGPRISHGPDGKLVVSWMEQRDDGTALRYTKLADAVFAESRDVVTEPRMFVNWADLPSVMHIADDHWIAHWLRYSADQTYSYDVVVSQSVDGGRSWSDAMTAHTDGTQTEHGFVSMHRASDGVALLWLDGRSTPDKSMTLRSAVITPEGRRVHEQLVDESVCDCCQTDVAVSSAGPLAVYRDRTADEIRDIYVTRFVDGEWEPGARLYADNWTIPGCPVNGPSIVAQGDDVAVAWFSAADGKTVVRVITSTNGGTTFGTPIEIAAGRLAGYVGLALLDDKSLVVSWVGRNESGSNSLNLRRVTSAGQAAPPHRIAEISQLRVFPQLGYQDGSLFLVWTDEAGNSRQLTAVRIPVTLP